MPKTRLEHDIELKKFKEFLGSSTSELLARLKTWCFLSDKIKDEDVFSLIDKDRRRAKFIVKNYTTTIKACVKYRYFGVFGPIKETWDDYSIRRLIIIDIKDNQVTFRLKDTQISFIGYRPITDFISYNEVIGDYSEVSKKKLIESIKQANNEVFNEIANVLETDI